jgi:hypothetical protein
MTYFNPDLELDAKSAAIAEQLCEQIGLAAFRKVTAALHRVMESHSGYDTGYFARGLLHTEGERACDEVMLPQEAAKVKQRAKARRTAAKQQADDESRRKLEALFN